MKKQFLFLPSVTMNLSQKGHDGDDFDPSSAKSQGYNGSSSPSYSSYSDSSVQDILADIDNTLSINRTSHDAPRKTNSNSVPSSNQQIDLAGLWYLVSLNGKDSTDDLIFYKITSTAINLLPYGQYEKYQNYTYTRIKNNVDFGNGPFNVLLDKKTLILTAINYNFQIVFTSVVQHNIHTIISEKVKPAQPEEDDNIPTTEMDGEVENRNDEIIKISKNDILRLFSRFKWKAYAYIYGNSSISYNQKDAQFEFRNDSTFILQNPYGMHLGTYEIKGNSLSLTYADGFPEVHSNIFMEYNKSYGYHFLFISEDSDKYKGSYTVYISIPEK